LPELHYTPVGQAVAMDGSKCNGFVIWRRALACQMHLIANLVIARFKFLQKKPRTLLYCANLLELLSRTFKELGQK
jgi:hypothetical protein